MITNWRKSSHSGTGGGSCVELGYTQTEHGVRDSKNPAGPVLEFTGPAVTALLGWVKASAAADV